MPCDFDASFANNDWLKISMAKCKAILLNMRLFGEERGFFADPVKQTHISSAVQIEL